MSKLILIGLAAATLGIGGLALPSEKSSNDSSETSSAGYVATASAAQPVAALAAAVTDDPFDRSAALCATGQYKCIGLGSLPDRPVTMGEFLGNVSFERVQALNNWSDGEVTLDTIVPRRKMIAFSEQS